MPWYRVYKSAEGDSVGAVELTREEFQAVKKFFGNIDWFYSESYSGHMGIHDEEHESKEEIIEECKKSLFYAPDCFEDYEEVEEDDLNYYDCDNCEFGDLDTTDYPCCECEMTGSSRGKFKPKRKD